MKHMRVTKFGAITQITMAAKVFPVNAYLVEEADGVTLVDAGMPQMAKAILAEIAKLGKPLTRVVLTHAHGDHIGAVGVVREAFANIEILMSEREARIFRGDRHLLAGESQRKLKGSFPKKAPFAVTRVVQEGDQVGSLKIVAVPGHTPGMIACFDVRAGALIAGDAFQTFGRVAVSGQVVRRFPFPAWATWCPETAMRSAEKLIALEPTLLLVGHGDALVQPVAKMREVVQRG
jgi:glyoxylase-like metal-dependent hydrolase (beta-lactamase superfamily II)